jgi:uncharacterized membrane protein
VTAAQRIHLEENTHMIQQRIAGIVLLVLGVVLLVIGLNASDSVADQVSETVTGKFTEGTMWYIIGGIALALLGLLLVAVRLVGRNTA